mmetsp:Transcript_7107/g.11317  ORF Transcript_7107/g.11317 Transcript_7107/m.11317 type:complete len:206 (+) Transcript_7107:784-1401(+)
MDLSNKISRTAFTRKRACWMDYQMKTLTIGQILKTTRMTCSNLHSKIKRMQMKHAWKLTLRSSIIGFGPDSLAISRESKARTCLQDPYFKKFTLTLKGLQNLCVVPTAGCHAKSTTASAPKWLRISTNPHRKISPETGQAAEILFMISTNSMKKKSACFGAMMYAMLFFISGPSFRKIPIYNALQFIVYSSTRRKISHKLSLPFF